MERAACSAFWPLWLVLVAAPALAEQADLNELVLGVHPYQSAQKVYRSFAPLGRYLAARLGRPVRVEIAADYAAHVHAIGTDQLDIAYIGPVPYLYLAQEYPPAKRVIARQLVHGKASYQGYLFVAADSSLQGLDELRGGRVAMVDPLSTMGYYLPMYLLLQAGIYLDDLGSYRFLESHDNVALAVLSGDFAAGTMREIGFESYARRGLRRLASTPSVPNHVFVASDLMSDADLQRLRGIFLSMADHDDGLGALQAIAPEINGMVAVSDAPFAGVEAIVQQVDRDCPQP